jgi:ATP-dependent Clp protease ATP-binding subunit ClpX
MDERLLALAQQAQQRLTNAEPDAGTARAQLHRAVHLLVVRGAQPRDVSAALRLTEQQVHEILEARHPDEGRGGTPRTLLACTFCGRSQHEASKLFVGPGVYICEASVEMAAEVLSSGTAAGIRLGTMSGVPEQDQHVRCSFCGKSRDQVNGMAAMGTDAGGTDSAPAAICTECLSRCQAEQPGGCEVR